MNSTKKKIFVAGHRGLVGSAIARAARARVEAGEPWDIIVRSRAELDLLDAAAVRAFYEQERPSHVVIAAAKVGGIKANNDFPVDFLLDNLKIQNNLIENAHHVGVEKLLFLGSSCIYPKFAPQPINEDSLLTGKLEPTNEAYAIAKIAGIKLCEAYRKQHGADYVSAMPTNMYGPFDNFDLNSSHVLPAMIHKFHLAKEAKRPTMTLWGTGSPRREFLHSADLADACLMLLEQYSSPEIINVRQRHGRDDQGTGRNGARGGRLRGRDRMGLDPTRRHAAQVDGRRAGPGVGLASRKSRCPTASRTRTGGSWRIGREWGRDWVGAPGLILARHGSNVDFVRLWVCYPKFL